MKKISLFVLAFATAAACQVVNPSSSSNGNIPAVLSFMGDGSDGAFTCTSGTCSLTPGEHWYSSFNVSAGATANESGSPNQLPLIIRVTGACTIAGSLNVDGFINTSSNWGGGGGGGGGGTAAGAVGSASYGGSGGGTAGASSGGTGGTGSLQPSTATQRAFVSGQYPWILLTNSSGFYSATGGSVGGAGGSSGGAGGKGGGTIILICGSINNTGTISASGANGGNSTGNSIGSGGGGGGGIFIGRSPSVISWGTIVTNGGSGGTCGAFTTCGAGGAGANGWSITFSH